MRQFIKISTLLLTLIIFALILILRLFIAPKIDKDLNHVTTHAPYSVSEPALALHDSLRVADLHADTLLWSRDLLKRHDYSHTDIPRLREGGVRLQIFSAVTKSPRGLNFENNRADTPDDITALAIAQLWPPRTWTSLYERAAYQAQRLQKVEAQSAGHFIIARTSGELRAAMDSPNIMAGLLEIEGSHPLEGKLENIKRLYDEGYRMMGLHHFFDTELGGSMHGVSKAGLTEFGFKAIAQMQAQGILLDMAHASEQSVRDVLAHTSGPLVLSHGGVRSACPRTSRRNLPDDILLEMAARGSLIGIGYFEGVICDITPEGIADALIYAADLLGEDVIALGSDFDGSVTTSLDASELSAITDALLRKNMPPSLIKKVMGENAIAFFIENLPKE